MIYQEVAPHPDLQAYVLNYWCFRVPAAAEGRPGGALPHTAPPDGCVSLMLASLSGGRARIQLLVGPSTEVVRSEVAPESIYVGIRFVPGMFRALFDDGGQDLKGQVQPAQACIAALAAGELAATLAPSFHDFSRLDELLLAYVRRRPVHCDPEVNRAVLTILAAGGNVPIRQVVAQACRSERPLQKAFRRDTYLTMKELAGVCRLRTAIIRHHLQRQPLAATVYDAGYYDQAHYNHELARATGQRPAEFYGYIGKIDHRGVKPYQD